MSEEVKIVAILTAGVTAIFGGLGIKGYLLEKDKNNKELEKSKIIASYPPEYWLAKKAQAETDLELKVAAIESKELLEIDARKRADAERMKIREFEKSAPPEYWKQKQIEAEEKTKRAIEHEKELTRREQEKTKRALDKSQREADMEFYRRQEKIARDRRQAATNLLAE